MAQLSNERLPNYQLGDVIGKGAFGVVFKALNWTTGETVAVKQIGLSNIPLSELPDLMSEINLLKNLDHPNIVQYRGSSRTAESLYIVLEYCENGSLHNICKRFGKFPESLVAQYICQVLDGLLYLHDQGVIHRDIKGSNILATKEGSVKLADFGVATQAGPLRDSAVVGSPYWMAPEIIDQSGATTASDIWSVGAVVVELLEGSPPYSDLDPMPALFRIVNDDCPPLPEAASSMCRDFLLQCFQKDCNLRISARKLLRHPWMMAARRQLDQTKREQLPRSARATTAYDETVNKVQEWNKALEAQQLPAAPPRLASRPSEEVVHALQGRTARMAGAKDAPLLEGIKEMDGTATIKQRRGTIKASAPPQILPLVASNPVPVLPKTDADSTDDSNWDEDFEEGIPSKKIAERERATELAPAGPSSQPKEDYSDLVEDDTVFAGRVANLRLASGGAKILHPRDLSAGSAGSVHHLSRTLRPSLPSSQSTPNFVNDSATIRPNKMHKPIPASMRDAAAGISRYAEIAEEEDDFSVLFAGADAPSSVKTASLQLTERLSGKAWSGDESEEEDPFAGVEEEGDSLVDANGFLNNMARDQTARLNVLVLKLIESMPLTETADFEVNELCLQLVDYLDEETEAQKLFVKEHGVLALLEGLQLRKSRDCIGSMLRILNIIVSEDPAALEKLCLLGGCPVVMSFASNRYARDIRLEAALFIGSACRTSLLTLQMFIGCRGLRVLVEMMDESYRDNRDLVWMAIDGVLRVFEMQGSAPRNEFCRVLAQEGLLAPLASALLYSSKDDDDLADSAKAKAVQILLLFGQSDLKVREALAVKPVVALLVKAVHLLDNDLLVALLKTLKNISMSAKALDILQSASAIEVLVRCLLDHLYGDLHLEISNSIVNALYNLCRLSKSRQEEAACSGVVPALMELVRSNSPLKQFALPMLCDFASSSKKCRKVLWQHDGLQFYLGLLRDPFWGSSGLDSIAFWLADDVHRVEDVMLQSSSVQALLRVFDHAKATTFENLLDPLLKILRLSVALSTALVGQASFLSRLTERLNTHGKPVVRLSLLRIVKTLSECLPSSSRRKLTRTPELMSTIKDMASNDPAMLVRQMAKSLLTLDEPQPLAVHGLMRRSNTTVGSLARAAKGFGGEALNKLKTSGGDTTSIRAKKSSK